jgi:hypothetical protein
VAQHYERPQVFNSKGLGRWLATRFAIWSAKPLTPNQNELTTRSY